VSSFNQAVSDEDAVPSRLVLITALVFYLGIVTFLAGAWFGRPLLLLISGPSLMLSAGLSWFGGRMAFSGLLGAMLREVLGPVRVATLRARALAWLVIGGLITLWGISSMHARPREEPIILPDPAFSSTRQAQAMSPEPNAGVSPPTRERKEVAP
jgi:hypothetical protein